MTPTAEDPRRAAAPVLLVGAGNLGGALLRGWLRAAAFPPGHLLVRDPAPSAAAKEAAAAGVALNPPEAALAHARTVVFAVKPQGWRAAAAALKPHLGPEAVVLSVLAGVKTGELEEAFGRRIARVMPTTAIGIARGVATLYAADAVALARAHALFDPVAATVGLEDEAMMDAAVGVSGSAPAYLYAFTEALAAAGEKAGLPAAVSARLARTTMESAAALMAESDADPAELRRQVTSPRGATEAALDVLLTPDGLPALLRHAVQAAADRSRALGSEGGSAR